MTLAIQIQRTLLVVVSVLATTTAFAGGEPGGRRDTVAKTSPTRGLLTGIDLQHFKDLRIVEEDVPPDAPTILLLDDASRARGRVSSHVAEVFVYKNFSAGRNNQTAFFFNWATTSGGSGDPDCPGGIAEDCFSPAVTVPGIFHADGAVFGGGFKAGETAVSSYEIFAFRSGADPDTRDLAFVSMELWDGDPLNAIDSTGIGFSAAPIPGTKVTFSGVPVNTRIVFRGELDPPVVTPHTRVWVVVTSDACRFGWLLSRNAPEVGADDHERLNALIGVGTGILEFQLDSNGETNGLGVCCGDDCDGAPCDFSVGMVCCDDPNGDRNQCVDGDAEDLTLGAFGGPACSFDPTAPFDACSNFWLNVLAQAAVTMTLQPTGNGALGALVDGARIEGNEIIMVDGGENVMMDIQISNFAPQEETFCIGGDNAGAACTQATEVADCGALDPNGGNFGCGIKLRAYQSEIDPAGYTSGIVGELTAMDMSCTTDDECVAAFGGSCFTTGAPCTELSQCPPAEFQNCLPGSRCSDGKCQFASISQHRADYVFRGRNNLAATDTRTPDYRWGSAVQIDIRPPDPFPAGGLNAGQLIMTTSADAKGTFTLNLKGVPLSLLLDAESGFIDLLGFVPAKITVSTGQCCTFSLGDPVCLIDQVTAAGCAKLGADNGFVTSFDPSKSCADLCPPLAECFAAAAPLPEPDPITKNRYLSFVSGNVHRPTAVRVTFVDLPPPHDVANGRTMWLGPPETISEGSDRLPSPGDPDALTFTAAKLQCAPFAADWSALGTIHIYDEGIIPGGVYEIREVGAFCTLNDPANLSEPLTVGTGPWGDVVGNCITIPCSPPNGTIDVVFDGLAVLDKFRNRARFGVSKARADLEPDLPDQVLNITDVTRVLDAFAGARYPFAGPGTSDPCAP